MKVVVDAMCSQYGGIATYVTNLLATWPNLYPEDELHVIAPVGVSVPTEGLILHAIEVRRPTAIFRPVAQTLAIRSVTRSVGADAVLATLPSTTVLRPGVPMVVVVYDLRHELRPDQFSIQRRLMRRLSYGRGYALADGFIAISQRTLDDLHQLHARTTRVPGTVAHLAADHVDQWSGTSSEPYALAFGHHSNKNTDLVIDAWTRLVDAGLPSRAIPTLKLIGMPPTARAELAARLDRRGLSSHIELAPFLPSCEFESLMAGTRLVVFPSDFEGFGLPVLEAMRLGVPVVVGPEPAVLEVAGGHATVMSEWSSAALVAAVQAALAATADDLAAAVAHARTFTWAQTTHRTRGALVRAVEQN